MPIAGPVENVGRVSVASSTVSMPFLVAPSATIPVGTLWVMGWCGNLQSITAACSDNSTQPGAANVYNAIAPAGGSVLSGGIIWCMTTRAILTSDTITPTFSGAGFSRASARYKTFTGVDTASPLDKTAQVNNLTASPCVMGPTAALVANDELAVSASFWKAGAALPGTASTAGYNVTVTNSGGTTTRVDVGLGHKLPVGTAAETDTHTWSSAPTAGCGQIATFKAAAAAPADPRPRIIRPRRAWAAR